MTKTDFSDDPRFNGSGVCNIHEDIRFAMDDGCPQCEEDECIGEIKPYVDYIEYLEKRISRLKILKGKL